MQQTKTTGLSGNSLKLIALIAMTADHAGKVFAPDLLALQIIGRLAFPIFAYMIAEGCAHTRSKKRYLLQMLIFAALCQTVYSVFTRSLYMCILVTFTLSIGLIVVYDRAKASRKAADFALAAACFLAVLFLCEGLPQLLRGTDFYIDYGVWGVLLPLAVYIAPERKSKIIMTGLFLLPMAGGVQTFSLLALIPLFFYSGTRGKRKMKYLFYIYYPLHLVLIELIYMLT